MNVQQGKGKVAVITNIPAPYRIALFKRLSETENFKFKFFFCASSEINRRWKAGEYSFDFEVLSGFSPTLSKEDGDVLPLHINPSILYKLRGFDLIICAVPGIIIQQPFYHYVIPYSLKFSYSSGRNRH